MTAAVTKDQAVVTIRRLRDEAVVEAEECDLSDLPRLAAFARGQADAFRISLLVLEGRSW